MKKIIESFIKFIRNWVFVGFIAGLAVGCLVTWLVSQSLNSQVSGDEKEYAVLQVSSDPSGANISGDPYCETQITPYECRLGEGQTETVFTAPDQVTLEGVVYNFKSWDGCSESNEDQKICKVNAELGKQKTLKVNYEKAGDDSPTDVAVGTGGGAVSTPQPAPESNEQEEVQCPGGIDTGDGCKYSIRLMNVPSYFSVVADQVTPFHLVMEGVPLDVECSIPDACYDYTNGVIGEDDIMFVRDVRRLSWYVNKEASVYITAEKVHTYTTNDGKTRKWKFKQMVKNSYPGQDYVSAQYDFVSMTSY